ncbi:MAG: hypothetical protein UT13_C0001G0663 [Candidatus Pacebacteria bacterium GW2011_GWF2_38_9]|nr:MAG: hypothetical protein US01_C0001G0692 [candidate division TM6 bacterium GW2011_GWF2_28_16]KKQ08654.1 MAG: hypothetical protein US20_C0013G0004 [Candidatus Pacebacteria bacterium GW2011_GWF1_36_5]KKQ89016.1 MAG: hypothetical protein UT13_C0001G0663 [Candidatus Pacebacteria bacterium GW2011_GWF2_38_9]HAZ73192.1 hypothetical protein [Candidatus Paceibacterota bacterium]
MSENLANNPENKPTVGSPEWNINYILNDLNDQAKSGGKDQANVENRFSTAGPYWPKEIWFRYCGRVKEQLISNGYSEKKADEAIAKATEKAKLVEYKLVSSDK